MPLHLRQLLALVLAATGAFAGGLAAQALRATAIDTLPAFGPAVYDRARQRAVMVRPIVFTSSVVHHDLVAWDGEDWVPILPPLVLPQRVDHLAYDEIRGRILAIGGTTLRYVRGTEIGLLPTVPAPTTSWFDTPENRRIVHDAARDELVVFGGSHTTRTSPPTLVLYDQTYVLRGGAWQEVPLLTRPAARDGHVLVYDPLRQRTVLFGGSAGSFNYLGDTWEWDGVAWTQIAASGPQAGGATGTYDSTMQRVVVLDAFGSTWAFDGSTWTLVNAGGARRTSARLVFDGSSLLAAGALTPPPTSYLTDIETWRLSGNAWSLVPTSVHIHPSYAALMAYDTVRRELLCVHGNALTSWIPTSTWSFSGRWRRHPGVTPGMGALAFDQRSGEVVLFGGWSNGETWTWNGSAWTQRAPAQSPPAQEGHRLAYDPIRQRTVLFGISGTWLWDGTSWAPDGGPQPPLGAHTIFVYDPSRAAIVLTGGLATPTATWEWAGQWVQRSSTSGLATAILAAFDPLRGRLVAFENTVEHEWTGTTWITRPGNLPLQLQHTRDMTTDPVRGRIVFRGILGSSGSLLTYLLGPTPSLVEDLGGGCAPGVPLTVEERPGIGTTIELATSVAPGAPAIFGFALQPTSVPIGACTLRIDGSLGLYVRFAGPSGRADLPLAIPSDPLLRGLSVVVQAGALPGGQLELSRALRLWAGD